MDRAESIPIRRVDRDGAIARVGQLHPLADGGYWVEADTGGGVRYAGTPPFVADMQPQGYLGVEFGHLHGRELGLPPRLDDWTDDHALIALARRGEDMSGDLVIGDESYHRLLADREHGPEAITDDQYPDRALHIARSVARVGGQLPKFAAYSDARACHVIVKFPGGADWVDRLAAESIALDTLADYGFGAPASRLIDRDGQRFLEVERFDRCGAQGRVGLLSMGSVDAEWVGLGSDWTGVAEALARDGWITADDCARIRWLDAFGALIGNSDRHLGNLSFYPDASAMPTTLALAPVYDMLPMGGSPPLRGSLAPPAGDLETWRSAATAAADYWTRVAESEAISGSFRASAREAVQAVAGAWAQ